MEPSNSDIGVQTLLDETPILVIHQKLVTCPYCGLTQENHLVTLNTPERRLETCMNVLADFVAHNLPSKWVKE